MYKLSQWRKLSAMQDKIRITRHSSISLGLELKVRSNLTRGENCGGLSKSPEGCNQKRYFINRPFRSTLLFSIIRGQCVYQCDQVQIQTKLSNIGEIYIYILLYYSSPPSLSQPCTVVLQVGNKHFVEFVIGNKNVTRARKGGWEA